MGDHLRITGIKTFLVDATPEPRPAVGGRNWLFVKVETDAGITGVGEASGWPRVVETAVQDLAPVVIGEDPFDIERLWQKMLLSFMGHGMTGVVGAGAMTGIEIALWDIKGKALGVPVWQLLGGKCRDRIRVYGHAGSTRQAEELVGQGYTAIKTGGVVNPLGIVREIRSAVGDEIDLCVDVHGPPWLTTRDAIRLGKALEPYNLLFYEDPVAPEDIEALARVASNVDIPIAVGERHAMIYGLREVIEREIVDVIQPDTGRVGGLSQMKKLAAMAEAHYITMAPHDGSNGPIAEVAAVHLLATLPNFLILEHLAHDVPWRETVVVPTLPVKNSVIEIPTAPGLGIEINEEEIARHPSRGNVHPPPPGWEFMYVEAQSRRAKFFKST
jgi:galactonate dehydratase